MHGEVEIREVPARGSEGQKLVLRGLASRSEHWYDVRGFEERFARGAWKRSLKSEPDVVLLVNHAGLALARTKTPTGTPSLVLDETNDGLLCEAFLDATAPSVQDLRSMAENCGAQMSCAFVVSRDAWNSENTRRTIEESSLHKGDVTVCNFGANDATEMAISARGSLNATERRELRSLKGARERRMCPGLDGYEVQIGRGGIAVARDPLTSSVSVEDARMRFTTVTGHSARHAGRHCSIEAARATRARAIAKGDGTAGTVSYRAPAPKYSRAQINALGREGKAHKAVDGRYHFPVNDREDVENAVRAVGRAPAGERQSIRRYIMRRASELKLTSLIPTMWHIGAS